MILNVENPGEDYPKEKAAIILGIVSTVNNASKSVPLELTSATVHNWSVSIAPLVLMPVIQ